MVLIFFAKNVWGNGSSLPPQFSYPPKESKIVKSLFWNENGERGDVCELVLGVGLVYNTRI